MSSSRTYRVPPFQRDYSWEAENWEDLWRDILALRDDPESSHYKGAVVLQSQDEKEFTIIDGQQRFATLSLVAIAVLQKIEELAQRNIEPDENRERQRILRRTFLGDRDPRSLRYSSKLFLDENNDDFYQSFLLQLRTPLNTRTLSRSNRLLWEAFRYFVTELSKLGDVVSDGESLAAFLTDIVASQLQFIQITVELDFVHLSSERKGIGQAVEKRPGNLYHVVVIGRHPKNGDGPKVLAHKGQGIGKGREFLRIPGSLAGRQLLSLEQVMSKQCDQREEAQQLFADAQTWPPLAPVSARSGFGVRDLPARNGEAKDHAEVGRVSIAMFEFAKPRFGCCLVYCCLV